MTNFDYKKFFEGKRVTKQGFGVLGRGFGVVKFLLECGAIVTVTDTKPRSDFEEQIKQLEDLGFKESDENGDGQVKYVFGEHKEEDFINCDFVIQASGVPKDNHYLNFAKQNNIPVNQESSLFVKLVKENFNNVRIIGVTGTRGKTTTTFLIYELLKKNLGVKKVHLGGNVQGVSTLEILSIVKENDFIVMELDSWVLQGFGQIETSPDISIFTNFMSDHMNYYKNDMREYFLDKANIFLYQKENDLFVTTDRVQNDIEKYLGQVTGSGLKDFVDSQDLMYFETHLLGQHNQVAINLVYKVAKCFKIDDTEFRNFVKKFKGVKGRLELIKEIGGVKIYNDTCATTGDATVAGLNALTENLGEGNRIMLICGGRDKELDMKNLINKFVELQEQDRLEIITLSDETTTGTKKLIESIKMQNLQGKIRLIEVNNLPIALNKAIGTAQPGDVILFSPAFASFGMFKNEYDRGDKFMEAVSLL